MKDIIRDKNGVLIEPNDILKVFHFIGARKKKHYMYKMAVLRDGRLCACHLEKTIITADYPLWTGINPEHYEVVQSNHWEKL